MTALFIISLIVLVLGILLALPVVLNANYNGESGRATVKYLIFTVYDSNAPKKDKQKKKNKKKGLEYEQQASGTENKKKKKGAFSNMVTEKGIFGTASFFNNTFKLIIELAGSLTKKMRISKFFAEVKVSGEDAAETAINYGKLSAVFYPACTFLLNKFKHTKKITAVAYPDFDAEKSQVDVKLEFRVAVVWVLLHGLKSAVKFLVSQIKNSVNDAKEQTETASKK